MSWFRCCRCGCPISHVSYVYGVKASCNPCAVEHEREARKALGIRERDESPCLFFEAAEPEDCGVEPDEVG